MNGNKYRKIILGKGSSHDFRTDTHVKGLGNSSHEDTGEDVITRSEEDPKDGSGISKRRQNWGFMWQRGTGLYMIEWILKHEHILKITRSYSCNGFDQKQNYSDLQIEYLDLTHTF